MKIQLTLKTPDVLHDSIRDAVSNWESANPSDDEHAGEDLEEKLNDICEKWFKYGELLRVEIDTEALTCTVVPWK